MEFSQWQRIRQRKEIAMKKVVTVVDLLRDYRPDVDDAPNMRVAKLVSYIEEEVPGAFIPKKWVAKVAFAMPRLPLDKAEELGTKLSRAIRSAGIILERESGHYIETHRYLGVRINKTDDSKLDVKMRNERRRGEAVIRNIKQIYSNINRSGLSSAEKRKEFDSYTKGMPLLEQWQEKIPLQLPAPDKIEDEKDRGKK